MVGRRNGDGVYITLGENIAEIALRGGRFSHGLPSWLLPGCWIRHRRHAICEHWICCL
jgi:hypothetical protein